LTYNRCRFAKFSSARSFFGVLVRNEDFPFMLSQSFVEVWFKSALEEGWTTSEENTELVNLLFMSVSSIVLLVDAAVSGSRAVPESDVTGQLRDEIRLI
jgi:hypothetical protein